MNIPSFLAYSVSNIVFVKHDGEIKLVIMASNWPEVVPEPEWRPLAMVGGFNTHIDTSATFVDVANAQLKAELGIEVGPEQCSDFLHCEHPEPKIINTPLGQLNIKRVAFDRFVMVTAEQMATMAPQGQLASIWGAEDYFQQLVAEDMLGYCSQKLQQIQQGFAWAADKAAAL